MKARYEAMLFCINNPFFIRLPLLIARGAVIGSYDKSFHFQHYSEFENMLFSVYMLYEKYFLEQSGVSSIYI